MPDGESTPSATAGLNLGPGKRSLIGWLRDADAMPWLGRRMTYTLCAPLLTLAGAATTVAAPLLLAPARFGDYVLLLAVFQYACALDLGLSQLADKALAGRERTEQTSLADSSGPAATWRALRCCSLYRCHLRWRVPAARLRRQTCSWPQRLASLLCCPMAR